jgi:Gpi18-like mannosyltransferase
MARQFRRGMGLYAVGKHLRSRTVGVFLAMLWCVVPHALVQNMAYSESLLTALCAWGLYALLRRQWLLAGTLCLFAGLTRPTANALT